MALSKELTRLATYKSWPQTSKISPLTLAKHGFSYNGRGDEVECFQCKTRISGWNEGDNPQQKHRQMAPNCQLLNGNCTDNLPMEFSLSAPNKAEVNAKSQTVTDGASNQIQNDELQPHGETSVLSSILDQARSRARKNGVDCNNNGPAIDRTQPDFDMLQSESERRSTFYDWPQTANADPMALAHAGFFYTGSGDRVQCFSCKGFIEDWKSPDVPRTEHRRRFPSCTFVHDSEVPNNPSPAVVYHFEPDEIEARMDLPTVRIILDMGYSRDNVKAVIKTRLSTTGDDFPNAESLLEAFFRRYM